MDYWKECIAEAFDDAKIKATDEQIDTVVSWVDGAHENYGMAHGYDAIPNPLEQELKEMTAALRKEQDKVVCPECWGNGRITDSFGPSGRSSNSECWKCRGEGKISY